MHPSLLGWADQGVCPYVVWSEFRSRAGCPRPHPHVYCTRRINCVPLSRWTFSVFELTTETSPEVVRENPFIPITPLVAGSRGLTLEFGDELLSEGDRLPPGYRVP